MRYIFHERGTEKILMNRHGSLIFTREDTSLFGIKEGEGKNKSRGTEGLTFDRPGTEKNGTVSCDRRSRSTLRGKGQYPLLHFSPLPLPSSAF